MSHIQSQVLNLVSVVLVQKPKLPVRALSFGSNMLSFSLIVFATTAEICRLNALHYHCISKAAYDPVRSIHRRSEDTVGTVDVEAFADVIRNRMS